MNQRSATRAYRRLLTGGKPDPLKVAGIYKWLPRRMGNRLALYLKEREKRRLMQ